MHRLSSALVQALEACTIVLLGLAIPFVPLLLVWAFETGFDGDIWLFWRVAADAWLVGHGVDLGVSLPASTVIAIGIPAAIDPFVVSLGALGSGLVTLLLAARSGARLVRSGGGVWGVIGGTVAAGALGLVVGLTATHATVAPNLAQAALLPALVMVIGLSIGLVWRHGSDVLAWIERWFVIGAQAQRIIRGSLAGGIAAAAGLLGLAGLLVAVLVFVHFTDVILLFEALGPTHLGALLLLLAQLALLPTVVVWGASWMLGSGFQIGTGSSVSPLGTDLGPVPAIPLLGVLEPGGQPWMLAIIAVPVLIGIGAGLVVRQRTIDWDARWWEVALVAVGGAVVGALILGAAAAAASGSMGPGRLAAAGPDALLVMGAAVAELGVGMLIGVFGGRAVAGVGGLAGGFTLFRDETDDLDDVDADGADAEVDVDDDSADADDREAATADPTVDPTSSAADADEQVTEVIMPAIDDAKD